MTDPTETNRPPARDFHAQICFLFISHGLVVVGAAIFIFTTDLSKLTW
jgi:hypothetical protein